MTVQARLRWAREQAGFDTAADFARHIELEVGTYRHHENGTRGVRIDMLQLYAESLKVDTSWLLTGKGGAKPNLEVSPKMRAVHWAPVINWVQAGQLNTPAVDLAEMSNVVPELSQKSSVVALEVKGTSMNRIAPPGCFIVIDYEDLEPKDGKLYVVRHGDETTFKRYRCSQGPVRLEPDSFEPHQTIYPERDFEIVGRVVYIVRPT